MNKIRKAVIPAGGLATRFLPASKAIPKEMFPVVDKPILQYLVEELTSAGIEEILILLGRNKECIPRHFDYAPELYENLRQSNKLNLLELADKPCHLAKIHYEFCYQPEGVAKCILASESFVGNEPFVMLFGDELLFNPKKSATKQMIESFEKTNNNIIGCKTVPDEETKDYGIMKIEKRNGIPYVVDMVEKPKSNPPSNLSASGKYILKPEIFEIARNITRENFNKENNFTDCLKFLASSNNLVACDIVGNRFDTGSKFGYIVANIEYALSDPQLGMQLDNYLKNKYCK